MCEDGISKMYWPVSETPTRAGRRGARLINEQICEEMRRIPREVRNGSFTRQFAGKFDNGKPNFAGRRAGEPAEAVGRTGASLGPLMSWLGEC